MRANNNNTNKNNNNYRAIASVTAGLGAGIIAGVTTDRIINSNNNNPQNTDIVKRTATTGHIDISNPSTGVKHESETVTKPQTALLFLKRKATKTHKTVQAGTFSPASSEEQTTFEQELKVNLPLSTSGLVVGTMVGVVVGVGTNYLLAKREEEEEQKRIEEEKHKKRIPPQAIPAISQLSEEERRTFQQFEQPNPGRLSPVSKMQYEHLKKIHDTTKDKSELLQIKFQLHDMAKRNT
jgi:Na+/glutamate symporter